MAWHDETKPSSCPDNPNGIVSSSPKVAPTIRGNLGCAFRNENNANGVAASSPTLLRKPSELRWVTNQINWNNLNEVVANITRDGRKRIAATALRLEFFANDDLG